MTRPRHIGVKAVRSCGQQLLREDALKLRYFIILLSVPKAWIQSRVSVASNASRSDRYCSIEGVIEVGPVPVVSTNSSPTLLEFGKDLELYFARPDILGKLVYEFVEQVAKYYTKVVVHHKIIHEVVENPVTQGNEGSDTDDHARFVTSCYRPTESGNQHTEEVVRFEERSEREEEVGNELVIQEAR
jgi:hypothetical protein